MTDLGGVIPAIIFPHFYVQTSLMRIVIMCAKVFYFQKKTSKISYVLFLLFFPSLLLVEYKTFSFCLRIT